SFPTRRSSDLTVAKLKDESDGDLVVLGSIELVQSLARRNLVDVYVLLIHPLVLGTGRRLFADGLPRRALRLADSKSTTTGVVMATYELAEPAPSTPSGQLVTHA